MAGPGGRTPMMVVREFPSLLSFCIIRYVRDGNFVQDIIAPFFLTVLTKTDLLYADDRMEVERVE